MISENLRLCAGIIKRKSKVKAKTFSFIVNDKTVYTSLSDFKSPKSRERLAKLQQMEKAAKDMADELDQMRRSYSAGNASAKKRLANGIISTEKKLEQLQNNIHEAEKEIRNAENIAEEQR